MKTIKWLYGWIEETILVIIFVFMAAMNFINVIFRYCFSQSFSFTEEITLTAFVWVSIIGVAAAYKRVAHLGMSFVVDHLPKKVQPYMALLSMICSVILLLLLLKYGVGMVGNQIKLNSKTPALNMPMWVQGLSIPIGSFLCVLRSLESGLSEFRRLRKIAKGVEEV